MADVTEIANTTPAFLLSEEDIPGAKLVKPVSQCSCAVLRRWLLCRGAKTSGKLLDLQRRVSDYTRNGLDKQYLRDPDGGIHMLRKKAEAGILSDASPQLEGAESFPVDGYSPTLDKLPKVTFGTVWRFMIETVASKKQIATAKPLVKGFNFFRSKHVISILYQSKDGKHFVKSKVLPSMKKNMVYSCYVVLSSFGFVLKGKCACPAGSDGRCNHIAATLFSLDELCKKRSQNQKESEAESCTSKTCSWSVPPKRKGSVLPVSQMKFVKHDYAKETRAQNPMFAQGQDVRAPHQREWSEARLKNMLEQLKELQHKTGQVVSWCHILPHDGALKDTAKSSQHVTTPEKDSSVSSVTSPQLISPAKEHPVSLAEINSRCEKIKKKLFVTKEEADEIETKTRGQSDSNLWFFHRKVRITASRCHRVSVLKPSTSPTKAIKEVMYSTINPTRQMKEGLAREPEIMCEYIKAQLNSGHQGLSVSASGLVISISEGYLGASPDGVVHDPTASDPHGLLEMKFIQTEMNEVIEEALLRKRICVKRDNGFTVNTKHQYFYQLQQCMFVIERNWIDFVVKGSQSSSLYIERVRFDSAWWDQVKVKLKSFFENRILPELAYPRIKHGLSRISI